MKEVDDDQGMFHVQ